MTNLLHGLVAGGLLLGAVPAMACSAYLVVLSAAAFFHRASVPTGAANHRLVVLVPAHDEAELIGRCLASLFDQSYPRELYRVVVIADNCQDSTAALARAAGAEVMVREDLTAVGKGRALRWATERLLALDAGLDAVVVVDADSVAHPELLRELAAELDTGAGAVQGEYLVLRDGSSSRAGLKAAALFLFHRVRFSGLAALGLPCNLAGNGMLIRRSVLETIPWDAFTSTEDLEYSLHLRLQGIRPRFASRAGIEGPVPERGAADRVQRIRWEGGRFYLVRTMLWPLLSAFGRRRDLGALSAAVDLVVPPLGLLALIDSAIVAVALILGHLGLVGSWLVLLCAIPAVGLAMHVLVGLVAGRAPADLYLSLIASPAYLLSKLAVYAHLARGLEQDRWRRTPRAADAQNAVSRFGLGSTGIDPVDMETALKLILNSPHEPRARQVCTVNLHFLATAAASTEVGEVLRASALNVPDGHPVVWLGRLAGYRVPGRVAGSDLLPLLATGAARNGTRLFLLGGEYGVAAEAARRLSDSNPDLVIAHHEPPLGAIDDLDSEAIIEMIRQARSDVLLVAFGHPKQELWISRHLAQLPVSVAIGVGCAFDLVAGRRSRAPRWMRACGLEWLYRLLREPRRLLPRYASDALYMATLLASITYRRRASVQ